MRDRKEIVDGTLYGKDKNPQTGPTQQAILEVLLDVRDLLDTIRWRMITTK
jgi:hypothetical protein